MNSNVLPPTPEENSSELTTERIEAMSDVELGETYKWLVLFLQEIINEKNKRKEN